MSDIRTRFLEAYGYLLKAELVTGYKDFASKISVSTSMITEISKGRSNVGTTAIQNIVLSFPINADWLLTGRGSMLLRAPEQPQTPQQSFPEPALSEPSYIYKMYQAEKAEKDKMLKDKEAKIDQLTQRIMELSSELAKICPEGLATVKAVSTKSPSSRKTQSVNSDNAGSQKP